MTLRERLDASERISSKPMFGKLKIACSFFVLIFVSAKLAFCFLATVLFFKMLVR